MLIIIIVLPKPSVDEIDVVGMQLLHYAWIICRAQKPFLALGIACLKTGDACMYYIISCGS